MAFRGLAHLGVFRSRNRRLAWTALIASVTLGGCLVAPSTASALDPSAVIFFSSDRGHDAGASAIYRVPANGGPAWLVYEGGDSAFGPVPSADGSKLIFTQ